MIVTPPTAVYVPPWMPIAFGLLGVLEDTRPGKSNLLIEQMHALTRGGREPDDVAWCSSAWGYVIEMGGYASPNSKRAADWIGWGVPCPRLVFGCTLVFAKADPDARGSGHVAGHVGTVGDHVWAIGGNQKDRFGIDIKPIASIVAKRWPTELALPKSA